MSMISEPMVFIPGSEQLSEPQTSSAEKDLLDLCTSVFVQIAQQPQSSHNSSLHSAVILENSIVDGNIDGFEDFDDDIDDLIDGDINGAEDFDDNDADDGVDNLQPAQLFAPYNMCKELNVLPSPRIIRAEHETAPNGFKIDNLLNYTGGVVETFDINLPAINEEALAKEIQDGITQIRLEGKHYESISQELLRKAAPGSNIRTIYEQAIVAVKDYEGLALPGGPDIEPEFYNPSAPFSNSSYYRRSIAEFALIAAAKASGKPVFGVCRGCQMVNVFFGGTLLPHIDGQKATQDLSFTKSSREKEMENLFSSSVVRARSMHHQACDVIAPGFEVVMEEPENHVAKLIVSGDGSCIGSQFHPEIVRDSKHKLYFRAIHVCRLFYESIKSSQLRLNPI